MKTLTEENIEDNLITHINKKTGKKVVIPIHPFIEDLVAKYNGKLPKQYSDQVVNREIKLIAKEAGLTDSFRFTNVVGGVKKEFVRKKWQLVTNHTGRRSMATNLLKHADSMEALPVLGMSLKTLERYNKITAKENAVLLRENSFFKK